MKTILILLVGFFPCLVLGQQINVPKKVTNSFQEKFQDAEDLEWDVKNDNFEASFYLEDTFTLSLFNKNGVWLETSSATNPNEVPQNLIDKVYKAYDGAEINRIFYVETSVQAQYFRIELENETTFYIITISHEGDIIEVSKKRLDEDEDSYENEIE